MKKTIKIFTLFVFSILIALSLGGLTSCKGPGWSTGEEATWSPDSGKSPKAGDTYINPRDGYVLVWVPGGKFEMGSDSKDFKDENPKHTVEVNGFWIGKYEVTMEQYEHFINTAVDRDSRPYIQTPYSDDPLFNDPKKPAIGIKFNDAKYYCDWSGLRMPTEAEWEFAASGGSDRLEYPTKDGTISHDLANYLGKEGKDIWEDETSPVGSFPPNPFGLHDMAGNAWEWTSSIYKQYPYNIADGREDMEKRTFRVMRGGSYHFFDSYCRTTQRHHFDMHLRLDMAGMRLAKSYISR